MLIEKTVDAFLQAGFWKVLNHLLITAAHAASSPWLVAEAFPFYSISHRTLPGYHVVVPRLPPWEWLSRHNLWNLFHVTLCVWYAFGGLGSVLFPPALRGPDCTVIFFFWLAPMQFSSKIALFVLSWTRDFNADYVDIDPNLLKLFKQYF